LSVDQLSDEALISAIAREEMWAMEPLYERYNRILYSLAYRMVADHQIAEDLLQDTFFLVWRHATLYSPQSGAARSWIVSIIHHRTIDYLRKVRRNSVLKETTWEEIKQDEQITSPDPWDKAWQNVQMAQVREALMMLPGEQRMVIELAYFHGWTHSEIASGCQIPLGTVKARMRLGLTHLRRILEEMGLNEFCNA